MAKAIGKSVQKTKRVAIKKVVAKAPAVKKQVKSAKKVTKPKVDANKQAPPKSTRPVRNAKKQSKSPVQDLKVTPIQVTPVKVTKKIKKTSPKKLAKKNIKKQPPKKVNKKVTNTVEVKNSRTLKTKPQKSHSSSNSKSDIIASQSNALKSKQATKPKGPYSADQWNKYQEYKKELNSKSNVELKAMLKKNNQSMTGNKDELIAKICDGKIFGQIPRCPSCFGGRPKMNAVTGKYYCSGYRDDEQFINCHKTYDFVDIKREVWIE